MYVLLYRGTGLASRFIRWQTWSDYSHASVQLNDGRIIESWQNAGVRILNSLKRGSKDIDCFKIKGITLEQEQDVQDFLLDQVGLEYDWLGVIRFLSRSKSDDPEKWFCSELVFSAFKEAGIKFLRRTNPWRVSPGLLARSPLLKYVGPASLVIKED